LHQQPLQLRFHFLKRPMIRRLRHESTTFQYAKKPNKRAFARFVKFSGATLLPLPERRGKRAELATTPPAGGGGFAKPGPKCQSLRPQISDPLYTITTSNPYLCGSTPRANSTGQPTQLACAIFAALNTENRRLRGTNGLLRLISTNPSIN